MVKFIYKKKALKFLRKQNKTNQERLLAAIYQLPKGDVRPLSGREPLKRLRVGNFRIIFDDKGNIIDIIDIGNRGDVYK